MDSPTVSVVMPTHNRGEILPYAVESILRQTLEDFELILVDDCSTDHTWSAIEGFRRKDGRIKAFQTDRNRGSNISYNLGIDRARGKYIAILDDDDVALPDRLKLQSRVLDHHSQIGVVGSAVQYFDERGVYPYRYPSKEVIRSFPDSSEQVFEDIYLGKYVIQNPSLMFRREIIQEVKYPPVRGAWADMTMLLQLAALGVRFHLLPDVLVLMRRSSDHTHMTKSFQDVHSGRSERLAYIRNWLGERQIEKFDHLHEIADKNNRSLFLLGSASRRGPVLGIPRYLKALVGNPRFVIYQTRHSLRQYLAKRIRRST